jgi:hypothetical protein
MDWQGRRTRKLLHTSCALDPVRIPAVSAIQAMRTFQPQSIVENGAAVFFG